MEMENQALQHVMNMQTQLMQQILKMQQQQQSDSLSNQANFSSNNAAAPSAATVVTPSSYADSSESFGDPLPPNVSSPITSFSETAKQTTSAPAQEINPAPAYTGTNAPAYSSSPPEVPISDPTKYGTYASPYFDGDRQKEAGPAVSSFVKAKGFVAGSLAEMRAFNATRSSKEQTSQFISDQARGIQEQAVNVMGGALGGAASGASLFLPGIVPGLVVGGAAALGVGGITKAFTEETKEALNYQDILQKKGYKFINAFESSDEMGGIGMGLEDRQDISKFLRHLAPEKYLDDTEMSQILEGAADNKLLKSVTDAKSFKKKFSEIVDAVKEITITMNQSIEEATQFMGEMESRGIATKDMPFISAQAKVMSSMVGIDPTQGAQILMQTSDNVVAGTSLNPTDIIESSSKNIFMAQQIQDQAQADGNDGLYHYIKNAGGAEQAGANFEQTGRQYLESEVGLNSLLGMFASGFKFDEKTGEFEVDEKEMQSLLDGNMTVDEMQAQSKNAMAQLTDAQKDKLKGTASAEFSQFAGNDELAKFMEQNAELMMQAAAKTGEKIDLEQGLVKAGIATDDEQAKFFASMIDKSSDQGINTVYNARVLKEEQDSHAISNSPGFFDKSKFWWEQNVTNKFGDAAQGVSDDIGQGMVEYQKFLTGVDDRSMVGGAQLPSFSREGLEEVVGDMESSNKAAEGLKEYDKGVSKDLAYQGKVWDSGGRGEEADKAPKKVYETDKWKDRIKNADEADELDVGRYHLLLDKYNKGQLDATQVAEMEKKVNKHEYGFVEGMRSDLVKDRASGKYDGLWGSMNYGMDYVATGAWNLGEAAWDHTGGAIWRGINGETASEPEKDLKNGISLDHLDETKKKLLEDKKNLNQELTTLYGDEDSGLQKLSKKKLSELEKAVKLGNTDKVKDITDNKQAMSIAKKYKNLQSAEKDYQTQMGDFDELTRYTKAMATAPTQLSDLLAASDVYTEAQIDDLLGSVRKDGKKTSKKIKKGKLSASEMIDATLDTQQELEAVFASMPEQDTQKLAEYLVSKDSSKKLEDFEDKSGDISTKKLQNYIMDDVIRNQHVSNPDSASDKKKASSKDAKDAAKEHQEAMAAFVSAFQNETQMLREGGYGGTPQSTSQSNSTSLGKR